MITLDKAQTLLVVVDVQGNLAQLMFDRDRLFENLQRLIKGARILEIPILWAEQVPEKLGPTVPEIRALLTGLHPIPKTAFSCGGSHEFLSQLESLRRRMVLLCGIETHVCVYQTAIDLLRRGYVVEVVEDAVSSRTEANRRLGLERIAQAGAVRTSTEMALFELQKVAEGENFRNLSRLLK